MSEVVQEKEIGNTEIPNGDSKATDEFPAENNEKKLKKKKPNNKKSSKFFFFTYFNAVVLHSYQLVSRCV